MRGIDRELLLGLGMGLILSVSIGALGVAGGSRLGDLAVVERARGMGMIFPGEERPGTGQQTPPAAVQEATPTISEMPDRQE